MLLALLTSLIAAAQPICNGQDWHECLARNEAHLVAQTPGVIRHGKTLVVGPVGRAAVFADRYFPNDEVHSYSRYLRGRLQQSGPGSRWLIIETFLWEGFHVNLANLDNGAQVHVEGEFVFAPSRNHFAAVSSDGGSGYVPNQIEIFSLGKTGIKSEYRVVNEDYSWQPVDGKWLSGDIFTYFQQHNYDEPKCGTQILLRMQSGEWHAVEKDSVPCE